MGHLVGFKKIIDQQIREQIPVAWIVDTTTKLAWGWQMVLIDDLKPAQTEVDAEFVDYPVKKEGLKE